MDTVFCLIKKNNFYTYARKANVKVKLTQKCCNCVNKVV